MKTKRRRKPQPIWANIGPFEERNWLKIEIIGRNSLSLPYITIQSRSDGPTARYVTGYIDDRDIRRLKSWVDECYDKLQRKRRK